MNRLIFTLLIISVSSSAFAQFEKGRILAGGDISFAATTNKTKDDNSTTTNSKTTSFSFNPKAGYFFIDNLAAGLSLNLSASTTKQDGTDVKLSDSGLGVSPFVRYYLDPGIFFQGQFGVGSSKFKNENGNVSTTTKFSTTNWSLGAGYAYFLNKNVAIEPFIGYGSTTFKNKSLDVESLNPSLFVNIGFQIYLDTKK